MNEQPPGAEQPPATLREEDRKPIVFAVRVDPLLREQVEGLRGITGQSVNEVGVEALNNWVTKTLADETVREKAMAGIEAEERKLQERRAAITGILGKQSTSAATAKPEGTGQGRSSGKQR